MMQANGLTWKIRRLLNHVGVDIVPFSHARHPIARRLHLFRQNKIDTVVDVGANAGQYGQFLRRIGYRGRIISFEPLSSAFAALRSASSNDPRWEIHNVALGTTDGTVTLNVSRNSESSSILPMLPSHVHSFVDSEYIASETVRMTTLASILKGTSSSTGIFVKVDTQGYERQVIEGAADRMNDVSGVQLEMSIVSLYEGESLMPEMVTFLGGMGLILMGVEPGGSDPRTGQLLQMDGLFFREMR